MHNGAVSHGAVLRLSGTKKAYVLLGVSVLLVVAGVLAPDRAVQIAMMAGGLTLMVVGLVVTFTSNRAQSHDSVAVAALRDFIEHDATPSFVCDSEGDVISANRAARSEFTLLGGETLSHALRNTFANPSGILFRLQASLDDAQSAREDIVTRKGVMRVSVHRLDDARLVWRIEAAPDTGQGRGTDGPNLPMVMVGRTGAVLFMNEAARKLLGQRVKSLDVLFEEPLRMGVINRLLLPDGNVEVLLTEVDAGAGRRAIYFLPAPDRDTVGTWSSFEDLPVPLVRFDTEGEVRDFNKMAAALIGPTLENGAQMEHLMEGLGRPLDDWLRETVSGRSVQQSEFLRVRRSDKEVFVQVALNRMVEGGDVTIVATLADATELKTLEAQFVQSQKMQAIGQLAGGIAHDFNNLLTAISGHCDLLLLRHDQGDADYSDLIQINQNANRAAALVGQLLAFSRKQTLMPEELDLRDTMSDLTHLLNRLVGEKVRLSLTHDPVLNYIRADKRQLEQVLMNLVVNARDAMPNGGEIKIETECVTLTTPLERDRVTVPPGSYVCLRVIDQGVGIPNDKLQKVFEPFFTTKNTGEGTGLGLSTAYGIVKQTGGFIFVDSVVGEGSCFSIMFPELEPVEEVPEPEEPKTVEQMPSQGDGVILLVEDEAPVRAFASRALRLRGYTVLEADSAESALQTLEDESLTVDLFVTDVVMPGKDGPSWVREARKTRPDVRVVFVSGYAEDKLNDQDETIPNSVFLPKPFSLNDLAETVHRQLH